MLKTQLETPRIEIGKSFLLAGLQQTYSMNAASDLSQQWQRFVPQIPKLPGKGGKVAYGVVFHARSGESFAYLTAIEISDLAKVPSEFASVEIPSQRYAIFSHAGHVSEIRNTMREIYESWLPASVYRSGGGAAGSVRVLERYGEGFNPETGTGDIELWIPIKS